MRLSPLLFCLFLIFGTTAYAETQLRVASFNASLNRNGPGLLLRDLMKGDDPQIAAVIAIIAEVSPDILLINEFDHDADGLALDAFLNQLRAAGVDYPHSFAGPVNTGQPSGLDLDGNGKTTDPQDAFGFGRFPGQYGMALLSRYPLDDRSVRSFQTLLWRDAPVADLPARPDGSPFPSAEAAGAMRLSSKSHWDVPVIIEGARLNIFASHPTPPVFDGPEDLNGRRNSNEIAFWAAYLDGVEVIDDRGRTAAFVGQHAVIVGDLNADPFDGDARRDGLSSLLSHPRIHDPQPKSEGAVLAAERQGGANARHSGDPALDTSDWRDEPGPGNLRVDYVLPTRGLDVRDAGVFWPAPDKPLAELIGTEDMVSSDHRLVWVDITLP